MLVIGTVLVFIIQMFLVPVHGFSLLDLEVSRRIKKSQGSSTAMSAEENTVLLSTPVALRSPQLRMNPNDRYEMANDHQEFHNDRQKRSSDREGSLKMKDLKGGAKARKQKEKKRKCRQDPKKRVLRPGTTDSVGASDSQNLARDVILTNGNSQQKNKQARQRQMDKLKTVSRKKNKRKGRKLSKRKHTRNHYKQSESEIQERVRFPRHFDDWKLSVPLSNNPTVSQTMIPRHFDDWKLSVPLSNNPTASRTMIPRHLNHWNSSVPLSNNTIASQTIIRKHFDNWDNSVPL